MLLYISKIFYNFAVEVGAIMGGIVGLKLISEYFSSKKTAAIIENYKKQYPKEKLNIDFRLFYSPYLGTMGKVYLCDDKTKIKHWIASAQTLTDLGFFWDDVGHPPSIEKFGKYQEGNEIFTGGKKGF